VAESPSLPTVKCLVWDLDDTLWDGVVLEGDDPRPFPASFTTLTALDERGILHAIASRSEPAVVHAHLAKVGLTDMFCAIEVGWGDKSAAIRRAAETLGIGLDTFAFVDNDAVERAEVTHALPMVRCYDATEVSSLPERPEFQPEVITDESRQRRAMYLAQRRRDTAEQEWEQGSTAFLASLNLTMTITQATEEDLARASELTIRTNQLNTTGQTFTIGQLREMCASREYEVLVARLTDRFGSYGTIGLAVSELTDDAATLKLLLMSCRVMSRGVGTVFLDHVVRRAAAAGRRPLAEFIPTAVNRIMLVTLRFAGFEVVDQTDERLLLGMAPGRLPPERPGHVTVLTEAPVTT
jgi:FkbH-like protein